MNIIDIAQMIAMDAHFGVRNKHDGEPYILHPQRVAILARQRGLDEVHQAVCWLHDVPEDTHWTIDDLVPFFPDHPEIPVACSYLDKNRIAGQENEAYYRDLLAMPLAGRVKLCDLDENFGRNWKIEDDEKRLRMAYKYSMGMSILAPLR